jgi:hypothetical protein
MLGLDKQSLLFPKLVFVRDGFLIKEPFEKSASNPPQPQDKKAGMTKRERTPVRIYRLDWTKMEEKKTQKQWDRIKRLIADGSIPDQPTAALRSLPESYAATMNATLFAVPENYMKAINHCTMSAMNEWEHPYPFDTIIREGCYEPAAAFVKVAFHLLADCIYDENKQYYGREWSVKQVFEQTALLRYWVHQVGSWVAFDNAGFRMNYGSGPRIKNTFITMTPGLNGSPDPVEIMMLDMLEFHDYLEAAVVRPKLPEMPLPRVDMAKIMAAGKKGKKV